MKPHNPLPGSALLARLNATRTKVVTEKAPIVRGEAMAVEVRVKRERRKRKEKNV